MHNKNVDILVCMTFQSHVIFWHYLILLTQFDNIFINSGVATIPRSDITCFVCPFNNTHGIYKFINLFIHTLQSSWSTMGLCFRGLAALYSRSLSPSNLIECMSSSLLSRHAVDLMQWYVTFCETLSLSNWRKVSWVASTVYRNCKKKSIAFKYLYFTYVDVNLQLINCQVTKEDNEMQMANF